MKIFNEIKTAAKMPALQLQGKYLEVKNPTRNVGVVGHPAFGERELHLFRRYTAQNVSDARAKSDYAKRYHHPGSGVQPAVQKISDATADKHRDD